MKTIIKLINLIKISIHKMKAQIQANNIRKIFSPHMNNKLIIFNRTMNLKIKN